MTDKYEVGVKLRGERGGKVSRSNTYYKTNQTTNAAQTVWECGSTWRIRNLLLKETFKSHRSWSRRRIQIEFLFDIKQSSLAYLLFKMQSSVGTLLRCQATDTFIKQNWRRENFKSYSRLGKFIKKTSKPIFNFCSCDDRELLVDRVVP